MGADGTLPYDLEAEQATLGAVFADAGECLPQLQALLAPAAFYRQAHQLLFGAMLRLYQQQQPVELLTLRAALGSQLAEVGGWEYLVQLSNAAAHAQHVEHYARRVLELWQRRRLLQACIHGAQLARDLDLEFGALQAQVEASILSVGSLADPAQLVNLAELGLDCLDEYAVREGYRHSALVTGLPALDRALGVVSPGDLLILAARTSMGKTALALQIAQVMSQRRGPVLFVSLEMGPRPLMERLVMLHTGIAGHHLKQRQLSDHQLEAMSSFLSRQAAYQLLTVPSYHLTTLELAARARRCQAKHGLSLLVVDYLQQLYVPHQRGKSRQEVVAEISRALKALALQLDVPVLALSQLSREVEREDGGRPQLHHLRESGAIEQDADLVALLHRPKEETKRHPQLGPPPVLKTEFLVEKSRSGPTGRCVLAFRPAQLRFEVWSDREERDDGGGRGMGAGPSA